MAAAAGIAEGEATRALFEGRLHPHFDDLTLIHEGLGDPALEDVPPNMRGPGGTMPDAGNLFGVSAGLRNRRWNERFGSIAGIESVETAVTTGEVVDGRQTISTHLFTVSGSDLGLRLVQRLGRAAPASAVELYDLIVSGSIARYAEQASAVRAQVDEALARHSAYSYFNLHSLAVYTHPSGKQISSPVDLKRDYVVGLREKHLDACPALDALTSRRRMTSISSNDYQPIFELVNTHRDCAAPVQETACAGLTAGVEEASAGAASLAVPFLFALSMVAAMQGMTY